MICVFRFNVACKFLLAWALMYSRTLLCDVNANIEGGHIKLVCNELTPACVNARWKAMHI